MSSNDADSILDWLLAEEDSENDDRRFYCSYLIGHVSLSLANSDDRQSFIALMQQALEDAFASDKLSEVDRTGILALWAECQSH